MENETLDENLDSLLKNEKPRIYSKKAILGFSVFFTTIFGGVLLMQNFLNINKKKEAYTILFISLGITTISIIILNMLEKANTGITYSLNFGGGLIITEFFHKKYFANEDEFEIKKIWKALLISIIITIPFLLALIYGQ
jgi:hypothetical protein